MRRRLVLFLALVLLAAPAWPAGKATRPHAYDLIAGGEQDYTVAPGGKLWAITRRLTKNRALLQSLDAPPAPDVPPGPTTPRRKSRPHAPPPGLGPRGDNPPRHHRKYRGPRLHASAPGARRFPLPRGARRHAGRHRLRAGQARARCERPGLA